MLILWCCWVKGVLGQCHGFGGVSFFLVWFVFVMFLSLSNPSAVQLACKTSPVPCDQATFSPTFLSDRAASSAAPRSLQSSLSSWRIRCTLPPSLSQRTPSPFHPYSSGEFYTLPHALQAHVGEKSLVLDPFCGTGSTLLSCAKFGARVVGVDIDERTFGLESEEGAPCGVETNFLQVVRIDPNFLARF